MYNWTEQSEQLFNTWQASQKALYDNFMSQKPFDYSKGEEIWLTMLDTWQGSVDKTLATQKESLDLWFKSANEFEGTPEEFKAVLKQGEEMSAQWQNTHADMWQSWFKMVREADVAGMTAPLQEAADEALKSSQNTIKQMMDLQASWMKTFTGE